MDRRGRHGYQDPSAALRGPVRRGRPVSSHNIPSFDTDAFKGDFNFDNFFNDLVSFVWALPEENSETASLTEGSIISQQTSNPPPVVAGFPVAESLLPVFKDVRRELIDLSLQVDAKLLKLKKEVAAQDAEHKEALSKLERGVEGLNDSFERLNSRISGVGQTAARIGNHLQSADAQREAAVQAIDLIKYLVEFNNNRGDLLQFSPPAEVFSNDRRMGEAAALTQKLRSLVEEEVTDENGISIQASPGLALAAENLREYSNDLENKLLARFDLASNKRDLATMAECAKILEQFNRGSQALQRYVATRPMFLDVEVMQADIRLALGENTISSLTNISSTARGLATLYSEILETMQLEAETVSAVFPSPKAVLGLLSKRVFYQRIQNVLEAMLPKPDPENPPPISQGGLAHYLRTLLIAYEKTLDLAREMKKVGTGDTDVEALVERELFIEHLEIYPEVERKNLKQLFHAKYVEMNQGTSPGQEASSNSSQVGGLVRGIRGAVNLNPTPQVAPEKDSGMYQAVVSECVKWNVEAIARCKKFCSDPNVLHETIQIIFGVLLDQVNVCTMLGLEKAQKAVSDVSNLKDKFNIVTTVSRRVAAAAQAAAEQAAAAGEQGVKAFLTAVKRATSNVAIVHQHFVDSVVPVLLSIDKSQSVFLEEMAAKLQDAEKTVLDGLQDCMSTILGEVDRLLYTEQKATDFKTQDDNPPDHRATKACTMVISYLRRHVDVVHMSLDGPNRQAFLNELGMKLHKTLVAHFQRFTFNLSGGLRLKRDVSEFGEFTRSLKSPSVDEKFENLGLLVNLFIVAPEGLTALMEGNGIERDDALVFVQLREDYKSANLRTLLGY